MNVTSPVLEGKTVRLMPLSEELLAEVIDCALSAPEVFTHIPWRMRNAAEVTDNLRVALDMQARGEGVTFGTRLRKTGELVGGTSIRRVDGALPSAEIGGTWIVPSFQRTRVNTEAKFLQLTHCFGPLGCLRVELKTDVRNLRSRAAILRVGAREEGVLRSHMRRVDGSLRDSVLFSILAAEWPEVRERLLGWLARE